MYINIYPHIKAIKVSFEERNKTNSHSEAAVLKFQTAVVHRFFLLKKRKKEEKKRKCDQKKRKRVGEMHFLIFMKSNIAGMTLLFSSHSLKRWQKSPRCQLVGGLGLSLDAVLEKIATIPPSNSIDSLRFVAKVYQLYIKEL